MHGTYTLACRSGGGLGLFVSFYTCKFLIIKREGSEGRMEGGGREGEEKDEEFILYLKSPSHTHTPHTHTHTHMYTLTHP